MEHQSVTHRQSKISPEVSYELRRMSFGARIELTRRLKANVARMQFLRANTKDTGDQAEAAILRADVDTEYVLWGVKEVHGLRIDGDGATPETLISSGPEELFREALEFVMDEIGLSEDESKNSESHFTSPSPTKPGGTATNVES